MDEADRPYWYPTKVDPPAAPSEFPKPPGISVSDKSPPIDVQEYLIGEILKLFDPGPNESLMKTAMRPEKYQKAGVIAGTNPRNRPMRGEQRVNEPWIHANRGRPSTKYPEYWFRHYGSQVMNPKEEED